MKSFKVSILTLSLLFISVAAALAAGQLVKDKSKSFVPIQSIQGISPAPAASACTTLTGTKGTIVTVDPAGYVGMKWNATDAAGAAVIVKRKLNSNTAFMPESSGTVTINSAVTGIKFDWYSSASKTTTICRELQ